MLSDKSSRMVMRISLTCLHTRRERVCTQHTGDWLAQAGAGVAPRAAAARGHSAALDVRMNAHAYRVFAGCSGSSTQAAVRAAHSAPLGMEYAGLHTRQSKRAVSTVLYLCAANQRQRSLVSRAINNITRMHGTRRAVRDLASDSGRCPASGPRV